MVAIAREERRKGNLKSADGLLQEEAWFARASPVFKLHGFSATEFER